MALDVFSSDGEDARGWTSAVADLPADRRDIHFLPEYSRIYATCYGYRAFLAMYRDGSRVVLQPFIRRPLGALPFLAGAPDAGDFDDLANVYGYGGPISNAADDGEGRMLYRAFATELSAWCEREGIASEFCSLHPLLARHQVGLVADVLPAAQVKDVVVIDLRPGEDEIAKGLRKGHRSSIALAHRSGVRVAKVPPSAENIAALKAMYAATMVRREAAGRWFFPDDFFAVTLASLGPTRTTLLFADVDGELESGCLLMHDFATAYYHFAGTFSKRPGIGANNLMVFEAAMHAKRAGFERLHLGGGVTADPDDSLLRFKAGFSPLRAPLYTYFTVRNRRVYDELCERKRAYECKTTGAEMQSDFVPLYRR